MVDGNIVLALTAATPLEEKLCVVTGKEPPPGGQGSAVKCPIRSQRAYAVLDCWCIGIVWQRSPVQCLLPCIRALREKENVQLFHFVWPLKMVHLERLNLYERISLQKLAFRLKGQYLSGYKLNNNDRHTAGKVVSLRIQSRKVQRETLSNA